MKWAAEPGHRVATGRNRGDLLPAAIVLLFVAQAFGPLLGRRALAGYDVTNYSLPNRVQVASALRSGHLPLWDPFRFGGAPLLASPPAAVLYPLSWPLLPLPPDRAEEVIRVLHVAIAALGAYAFARRALETSAVSGLVAAIAFGLGGFVHAHIGHIEQTTALAWLPWALLATDRALAAPRFGEALRPMICLGFALALCGLAGHPQYLHMGIALVAAYAVMTARPWRRSPRVLAGVALGLALSAVQLLPTWSLSRHSMRAGGLSFSAAAAPSLPWREAVTAFLPDYFGPVRLGPVEFWAWVPWSILLLAGVALAQDMAGRKRGRSWFSPCSAGSSRSAPARRCSASRTNSSRERGPSVPPPVASDSFSGAPASRGGGRRVDPESSSVFAEESARSSRRRCARRDRSPARYRRAPAASIAVGVLAFLLPGACGAARSARPSPGGSRRRPLRPSRPRSFSAATRTPTRAPCAWKRDRSCAGQKRRKRSAILRVAGSSRSEARTPRIFQRSADTCGRTRMSTTPCAAWTATTAVCSSIPTGPKP